MIAQVPPQAVDADTVSEAFANLLERAPLIGIVILVFAFVGAILFAFHWLMARHERQLHADAMAWMRAIVERLMERHRGE